MPTSSDLAGTAPVFGLLLLLGLPAAAEAQEPTFALDVLPRIGTVAAQGPWGSYLLRAPGQTQAVTFGTPERAVSGGVGVQVGLRASPLRLRFTADAARLDVDYTTGCHNGSPPQCHFDVGIHPTARVTTLTLLTTAVLPLSLDADSWRSPLHVQVGAGARLHESSERDVGHLVVPGMADWHGAVRVGFGGSLPLSERVSLGFDLEDTLVRLPAYEGDTEMPGADTRFVHEVGLSVGGRIRAF